jgi:hypothetical protein
MMQWFGCSAIQPDHFKSEYRMSTPLFDDFFFDSRFHFSGLDASRDSSCKPLLIASLR